MGAEGSVAVADGHRSLKDWCKRLADIDPVVLLAYQDRDWRQPPLGLLRDRLCLGEGGAERHEVTFGYERRTPLRRGERGVVECRLELPGSFGELRLCSHLRRLRPLYLARVALGRQRLGAEGELGFCLGAGGLGSAQVGERPADSIRGRLLSLTTQVLEVFRRRGHVGRGASLERLRVLEGIQ